ncbi:MAG: succinylglutamate desuccinylase/aspartoacylase family protein [Verrucomicrobiaceae bacterium]|nr:succinylglutamate desuccinylase/aspartoacylase family protein [Verrucomicrobiaceae bacterium]
MIPFLPRHRAHDYAALMAGWERVATKAGLQADTLGMAGPMPIVVFQSAAAAQGRPAVYLSAGVHGDEPAPPWGLLAWAIDHPGLLRNGSFILSPCLNPVGLVANTRLDGQGRDLNRRFHLARDPLIKAWRKFMKGRPLDFGLCLHEDYDSQGCYVYEISRQRRVLSEEPMAAVEEFLPRDLRREIEGRAARRGIIRPKIVPPGIHGPEALFLHQQGCGVTLTFETPSEFGLDDRVRAHRRFIEASLEHIVGIRA